VTQSHSSESGARATLYRSMRVTYHQSCYGCLMFRRSCPKPVGKREGKGVDPFGLANVERKALPYASARIPPSERTSQQIGDLLNQELMARDDEALRSAFARLVGNRAPAESRGPHHAGTRFRPPRGHRGPAVATAAVPAGSRPPKARSSGLSCREAVATSRSVRGGRRCPSSSRLWRGCPPCGRASMLPRRGADRGGAVLLGGPRGVPLARLRFPRGHRGAIYTIHLPERRFKSRGGGPGRCRIPPASIRR